MISSTIVIGDTTAPISTDCSGLASQGPFYTATPADSTATVTWTEPTWSDDSGVAPTVTKSPNQSLGDTLTTGTVTITYTATDGSSNSATCVVTFDIQGIKKYLLYILQVNESYKRTIVNF